MPPVPRGSIFLGESLKLMYFLKNLCLFSRAWSMQTKCIIMMIKERSTKIINLLPPEQGFLYRGVAICYRVVQLIEELSPNLQRLDRQGGSYNQKQQRTEDHLKHHQRPGQNLIHICQKFRLSPTKILSENRAKVRCSYSNRCQNVFTSGLYMYF